MDECERLGHEFSSEEHDDVVSVPTCLHCGVEQAADKSPSSEPRFWFASNGFENTPHPCLCMDDPLGGDPKVLGLFRALYRPNDISGMCELANAYLDIIAIRQLGAESAGQYATPGNLQALVSERVRQALAVSASDVGREVYFPLDALMALRNLLAPHSPSPSVFP